MLGLEIGLGEVLGIYLGLGLVLEIDSEKNITHFLQAVANFPIPLSTFRDNPAIIHSRQIMRLRFCVVQNPCIQLIDKLRIIFNRAVLAVTVKRHFGFQRSL